MFVVYAFGYLLYSRYLGDKIFDLGSQSTPAHNLFDGIDYVPTNRWVLFGHHFASITGLSPMLGPAVAVIWGWFPAMLWVVIGAVFIGCVHDFVALVMSVRNRGSSLAEITNNIVNRRAKMLFHFFLIFAIALAMGVFVYVIAVLFAITPSWDPNNPLKDTTSFPSAVLPSAVLIVLALIVGYMSYVKKFKLPILIVISFGIVMLSIFLGLKYPLLGFSREEWLSVDQWIIVLLVYSFVASILPVWSLLQARDFLNSILLYLGLIGCYAGIVISNPEFAAPALRLGVEGAPPIFPFVFIVIACGAVSGFHGIVASGTTAKQLDKETDARPIGYGGMIGESLLGLLAIVAATSTALVGGEDKSKWVLMYEDWESVQTLGAKLGIFITGSARFISSLGLSLEISAAFMAVIVVSFALTTLDSATRLLRFNLEELANSIGLGRLNNRYFTSIFSVLIIAFFAFFKVNGKPAGLILWQLFGTTNQLLAALTLIAATLFVYMRKKNVFPFLIPAVLMTVSTIIALLYNLNSFYSQKEFILVAVGIVILFLAVWLMIEILLVFRRIWAKG